MTKFLSIVFFLSCGIISAHKNVIFQKSYGNVNLISSTPYYTEDINKNIITAKYVEILLEKLNYKDSIYLWIWPDRELKFRAYFAAVESKQKCLNINIPEDEIDILKTLSLVENVILNQKSLDKNRSKLLSWYNLNPSKIVQSVFLSKVKRPNDVSQIDYPNSFDYTFDYYFENGIYHILSYQNREVIEVAQVNKILQFKIVTSSLLFIFTEKNSISIITANYKHDGTKFNPTSESVTLEFKPKWDYSFQPFSIRLLGKKYITIESMFGDQVSLYNISTKKLIYDLSTKIDE